MKLRLWDVGTAGASIIKQWEHALGCPCGKWDKDMWRCVALALAIQLEKKPASRPKRAEIPLISYFATQRIEEAVRNGERLSRQDAIEIVYREWFTHQSEMDPDLLDTLVREERQFRKESGKK